MSVSLYSCNDLVTMFLDGLQVLFKDGVFQWKRLENLIALAREQVAMMNRNAPLQNTLAPKSR